MKRIIASVLAATLVLSISAVAPPTANVTGLNVLAEETELVLEKSKGNPITVFDSDGNQFYAGDPAILVDGDTVYLYVGHDNQSGGGSYSMPDWHCYSSTDLENWVHERGPGSDGAVMSADTSNLPWASGNEAWAGQVMKHFDSEMEQDYYYFYHCSGGPKKIGVGVADTPAGWSSVEAKAEYCDAKGINNTSVPNSLMFKDIGQPLVSDAVTWPFHMNHDDIDPTVWVETDENGVQHGYLGWGNTWFFIAELNDDMISIKDQDDNGLITMKTTRSLLTRNGAMSINHNNDTNVTTQLVDVPYTYPQNVTYTDYQGNTHTIPKDSEYLNGDIICSRFYTANKYGTTLTTPYTNDERTKMAVENEGRDLTGMLTYNEDNTQLNGLFSWRWNELYQVYDPNYHFFTEGPYLYRRQDEDGNYYGKYYSFFAMDWREKIGYATTDDLLEAEWEFQDMVMPITTNSDTNHPAVFDFKGKTYFIYHNASYPWGFGQRRIVCIEEIIFDEDGLIQQVEETSTGLTGTTSWIQDGSENYITHENFQNGGTFPYVGNNTKTVSMLLTSDEGDSKWEIIQGRADADNPSYVSIESWNRPGTYLTASGTNIVLSHLATGNNALPDASTRESMLKTVTFKTLSGLNGNEGFVTFESVSSPGMYLTSQNNALILTNGSDVDACSFTVTNRAALKSISAEKTQTVYAKGEQLSTSDITVKALRQGGTTEEIKDYTIDTSGIDMNTIGKKTIQISYREDNFLRTCEAEIAVAEIALNQNTLALKKNASQQLKATVNPSDVPITWSSDKTGIASVDQNGKVTGNGNGTANITAKAGDVTATCKVTVTTDVASIKLSKTSLTLKTGNKQKLTPTVSPSTASNRTVTWTTSNKKVATVKDGTITAVGKGTATITAKAGTKTATCKVTVNAKKIASRKVKLNRSKATLKLRSKKTVVLKATMTPKNSTDKIKWTSSNKKVATVKKGKVTAKSIGKTTITAKTTSGKKVTCKITVKK